VSDTLGEDAAFPYPLQPGVEVGCFYIGGDATHIWTPEEVNALTTRYRLPIFVRSNPGAANPVADASAALAQLGNIPPRDCLIALDLETASDTAYVQSFAAHVSPHPIMVYGSAGNIFGTSAGHLVWVADPGAPSPDPAATGGTQYLWSTSYDLDWFTQAAVNLMWDTVTPTTPPWVDKAESNLTQIAVLSDAIRKALDVNHPSPAIWKGVCHVDLSLIAHLAERVQNLLVTKSLSKSGMRRGTRGLYLVSRRAPT
jgi:hypothetical protein